MATYRTVRGCTVVDQKLTRKKDGTYIVVLTCRFPPDQGGEEQDVLFNFGTQNQTEMAYKSLRQLGFTEMDFTMLDPGHEKFFPLKGKRLDLSNKEGTKYWNLALPAFKVDLSEARKWVQENKDTLKEAAEAAASDGSDFKNF